MKVRNYKFDNIKGILIFLVVLGHSIEKLGVKNEIYNFIYLFHMPVFAGITGITFRNYINNKKILKIIYKTLVPYIIFQIFYVYIKYDANYILNNWKYLLTPVYHMWYLLALFFWSMITIFFKKWINLYFVIFFIFLGIIINVFNIKFNTFAIGRTVIFYPLFLFGYLYHIENISINFKNKFMILGIFLFILNVFCRIPNKILYGTHSYYSIFKSYQLGIAYKVLFYCYGFYSFFAFFKWTSDKKYKLSFIGENTSYIYLYHEILIFIIRDMPIFKKLRKDSLFQVLVSVVITIILAYLSQLVKNLIKNKNRIKIPKEEQ